jgi:isopentenyl-diphosphate delta-isomerase
VVLLNEAAKPVGCHPKATVHHARTPLHLAFSVFLFDRNGGTLFQQRAWHKPTWPGVWSNACCGHPAPGETLVDAARRRLRFELGITAPLDLELALPHFRYRARWQDIWENEVCPVFVATFDGVVHPNPDEVAAVRWIRWPDFARASAGAAPSEYDAYSPWSRWEAAGLLRAGGRDESRVSVPETQNRACLHVSGRGAKRARNPSSSSMPTPSTRATPAIAAVGVRG